MPPPYCKEHWNCRCGNRNSEHYRPCHYCRKRRGIFPKHYICLHCCIGFKPKYVQPGSEEYARFIDKRCPRCGKNAILAGRDFRLPKQRNKKAWAALRSKVSGLDEFEQYRYFSDRHTVNCGGSQFPHLEKKACSVQQPQKGSVD